MTEGSSSQQSRLWVFAVLPAVILNIFAILIFGSYYALQAIRPDMVAEIHPDQVQFLAYVVIFVVEWAFVILLLRQQASRGKNLASLMAPNGHVWAFRWLPAIIVFIIFNALFIVYIPIVSALYGQWPRFHDLATWQRMFLIIAVPFQAAFCEELIWRGHLIPELIARGRTIFAAVALSALSFALIHGIFLIDKLILTFILGLVTGFYYVRERNLFPLMLSHFIADLWTFGLSAF